MSPTKPNVLRGFIYVNFGGFQQLAKMLNLATSTVSDWTTNNPRNTLKYMPEICEAADVPYSALVDVVLEAEHELQQKA